VSTNCPTIDAGGEIRKLSLQPRDFDKHPVGDPKHCHGVVGVTAGAPRLIPMDELPEFMEVVAVDWILDQDGHETCHSHGGTTVNECRHKLAGGTRIKLSVGYLVHAVTGGRDEGAGIGDVMEALIAKGQSPDSDDPGENYGTPSAQADADAAKFKIDKSWDCGQDENTLLAVLSNMAVGNPVLIGTAAFGGGHAVSTLIFFKASNGKWYLAGPNSWGLSYTGLLDLVKALQAKGVTVPQALTDILPRLAGYWCYPLSKLQDVAQFGAWGLQASVVNPDDVPAGV
jgi:hypothetical protein